MKAFVNRSTYDFGAEAIKPARPETIWVRSSFVGALLFAIAFSVFVRMHLRNMPLERDEGEFAYVGQLMLQGIPPYKIACNMKLPGTYAAYAAMMAVFGETPSGIRIGLMLVNIAATVLVFFLGKYLYGWLAGTVAGMTYSFLSCRPAVLGFYAHATHFVILAALAGILLLLYAIDTKRTRIYFGSGLCFGLAFLMKQPGILFAVFAVSYWLWQQWRRPFPWRNLAVQGGAIFAGLALPFAVTCLMLFRVGVFPSFWFWTWSYAREYAVITTLADVKTALRAFLPWVIRPFVIWEIVAIGLTAPFWSRFARPHAGFVTSFFLFSCLAVCPGFYFRPHYYILVLPAAALGAGIAVSAAQEVLLEKRLGAWIVWFPVLYFAVAFVISARAEYRRYFRLDPVALVRRVQAREAFPEAVAIGSYIKAHASDQDTIGLFGSEPEICFYSARHCASSYLYLYPLMEKQKFAHQMQDEMMQQVRNARPRFLVYVDDIHSWGWKAQVEENRGFVDSTWAYAQRNYEVVDQVAVAGDPDHLWGDHACLYVFRRKEKN
jgi:Dolichyl-phosphate-mannose-protein mannosyltransferase